MSVNWLWLIIGVVLGMFVLPAVLGRSRSAG